MNTQLPQGPRMPSPLQTLAWWSRPTASWRALPRALRQALHGPPARPVAVRDHLRPRRDQGEVFTAPPEVLHPGEGARILEPVIGANSVILLDEGPHLRSAS